MKILLINLYIFFYFNLSSQIPDTTNLRARWIAVKDIPINQDLFNSFCDSTNILTEIKYLVENHKITIHYGENYECGRCWYPIFSDSIPNSEIGNYQLNIKVVDLPNYYNKYDSKTNEINRNYYENKIFYLNFYNITEIRIKEERIFKTELNKYEFEPVGISFCVSANGIENELFWFDFKDLTSLVKDKKNVAWCDFIKNKKYKGFQYLQISTEDNLIRY